MTSLVVDSTATAYIMTKGDEAPSKEAMSGLMPPGTGVKKLEKVVRPKTKVVYELAMTGFS